MPGVNERTGKTLRPRARGQVSDHPQALAWQPYGSAVAVAALTGHITVFQAGDGAVRATLAGHAAGTLGLAMHPTGTLLASGGQDGALRFWSLPEGQLVHEHPAGRVWIERLAWSPDGRWCVAGAGKRLLWWDQTERRAVESEPLPATISDVAWSPDGRTVAATSYGGVWIWSPGAPRAARQLTWKGSALRLAWSPDGRFIATGDQDASVHFWYVADGRDLRMWGFPNKVRELAWDAGGRYLATGGGPDIAVWDCADPGPEGREPFLCQLTAAPVTALSWRKQSNLLVGGHADGSLALWQPPLAMSPVAQGEPAAPVVEVCWSPGGQALVVARADGQIEFH